MIQLKVYDSPERINQYWIDLYETEPIKLTLSIEDITNADATSVYSKSFKVPGTRQNNEFFKNAFVIDGVLFDVTVKKPAEILVDGVEFKGGHVRLQKIFENRSEDKVEYELIFLGETRDFSAVIADAKLCDLYFPDLIGDCTDPTGITSGPLQPINIETSWLAYPQSPSLTAGLANGDIIYPLIDHGNTYDDAGLPEQSVIAIGNPAGGRSFTSAGKGLNLTRFKPMIRLKRVFDEIFASAGYTYDSEFLNSPLVTQMYVSAFGNKASVDVNVDNTASVNVMQATRLDNQNNTGNLLVNETVSDPGQNYSTVSNHSVYTVPATGTYTIRMATYYLALSDDSNGIPHRITGAVRILKNGVTNVATGEYLSHANIGVEWTGSLLAGDIITMNIVNTATPDYGFCNNSLFQIVSAPGVFNPASEFDCLYKQVDFVKDILTMFRLVLAPDKDKPLNFIIEPWQTYINSGEIWDWSNKLVENKDVVIEPVFFTQSSQITFHQQQDGDFINKYHYDAFQNEWGYLQFNSNNDLLKGKRDIKLLGMAPTEILQVEGTATTEMFVIPQLHAHTSENGDTRHNPIKGKTRIMFYNGKHPVGATQNKWYMTGGPTTPYTDYPLVSTYQDWPIKTTSLNLNWANDVQYWGTVAGYNKKGVTLYDNYWSRYVESLYNKFSRRVTAYFVLNNIDLNTFSFDDTVFVNGVYYRPEKINNLQIGDYTEVQVELLTANDFRPAFVENETLTNVTLVPHGGDCGAGLGYITVTTDGTPNFTWVLSNGQFGVITDAVGLAPYTFDILNVAPGSYTLTITDSLNRTFSGNVVVPISIASPVTSSYVFQDPSVCTPQCDGTISVTPSGGVAPYTIHWSDTPGTTSFNRIYVCPGIKSYYIKDANNCQSDTVEFEMVCTSTSDSYIVRENSIDCLSIGTTDYVVADLPLTAQIGDVVSLNEIPGCFTIISNTLITPTYSILTNFGPDCTTCYGIPATNYFEMTDCDSVNTIIVDFDGITPAIGSVWNLTTAPGAWTVTATSIATPTDTPLTGPYASCEEALPCLEWQSIPYDTNIFYTYIDCNGVQQSGSDTCFSPICRKTICAREIISSTETFNVQGPCTL